MDPVAVVKVEPTEIATPAERLKIGDLSGFANQSDRVYNKVFQSFKGTKTRKLSLKPLADNVVLPANDPENVVSAALPVAALAPDPKAKIRAETSVSKATTVPTAARNSQGMREPWLNLTKAKNF